MDAVTAPSFRATSCADTKVTTPNPSFWYSVKVVKAKRMAQDVSNSGIIRVGVQNPQMLASRHTCALTCLFTLVN